VPAGIEHEQRLQPLPAHRLADFRYTVVKFLLGVHGLSSWRRLVPRAAPFQSFKPFNRFAPFKTF
jgi:hypothetical protein